MYINTLVEIEEHHLVQPNRSNAKDRAGSYRGRDSRASSEHPMASFCVYHHGVVLYIHMNVSVCMCVCVFVCQLCVEYLGSDSRAIQGRPVRTTYRVDRQTAAGLMLSCLHTLF